MIHKLILSIVVLLSLSISTGVTLAASNNPNVTNAVNALEDECPFIPSSETSTPLPKMLCHDPECQEYLFSGNNIKNATLETKCWIQPK